MYAFPEGSIIYPNEPVITIVAPHRRTNRRNCSAYYDEPSILIATKANRIVRAADGRVVADFGASSSS